MADNLQIARIRPEDVGNEAAIKFAKNQTKGFRTSFSGKLRVAQAAADTLVTSPTPASELAATFALGKAQAALETLSGAYCYQVTIMIADETANETILGRMTETEEEYAEVAAKVHAAI
jgi:ribosomal protein S3